MFRATITFLLLLVLLDQVVSKRSAQQVAEEKCQDFLSKNIASSTNCSSHEAPIVNSQLVSRGKFPHHTLLAYLPREADIDDVDHDFRCDGALISERFVLTAAHCEAPLFVRLGVHHFAETINQQDYVVSRFVAHPLFDATELRYDIALVELEKDVEFDFYKRPACLWTTVPLDRAMVIATGLEVIESEPESPSLMKVHLEVKERSSCTGVEKVTDDPLCGEGLLGSNSTCFEELGNPIQVVKNLGSCVYHVVGVRRTLCKPGDTKIVYNQVANHLDWIVDTVWPE